MSSSPVGKHAGPGPASNQPAVAEPSFAERARTLMYLGRTGSLSTLSRKQPGFPFGSVMPYGLDGEGRPVFLISTMAMHTQNLQADARASLSCDAARHQRRSSRGVPSHAGWKCFAGAKAGSRRGARTLPGAVCQQQILGGFRGLFVLPHGCGGYLLCGRLRSDGLGYSRGISRRAARPSGRLRHWDYPAHECGPRGRAHSAGPADLPELNPRKRR